MTNSELKIELEGEYFRLSQIRLDLAGRADSYEDELLINVDVRIELALTTLYGAISELRPKESLPLTDDMARTQAVNSILW